MPSWTITVQSNNNGQRADRALSENVPGLSRRFVRQLALKGHLSANGSKIDPSYRVHTGQILKLCGVQTEASSRAFSTATLISASDRYVYFCKPSGMHTVGRYPDQPGTLAQQVAQQFPECKEASLDLCEAGALHRLDRSTSGIVAFARDRKSWELGRLGFSNHKIRKLYIARCCPKIVESTDWPPHSTLLPDPNWIQPCSLIQDLSSLPETLWTSSSGSISCVHVRAPIGRGSQRDRVSIRRGGRPSESKIQSWINPRLQRKNQNSSFLPVERWMLIDLLSGTRHQARIHLASLGWPIKNDTIYGGKYATGPLMLHAYMLDLSLCIPNEVGIYCDPPSYFSI